MKAFFNPLVIPAQAGIHGGGSQQPWISATVGSGLRRGDELI